MAIKFLKWLSVLANILALVLFIPGIALAAPYPTDATSSIIISQASNSFSEIDLTPLQRQKLQAVRQRRNKEIQAVLDSSQRAKLAQNLHIGNNLNQALEKLDLQPEQQELVKAILQFTNLKMKAIYSQIASGRV
ncbi:MAG: hypothetical protein KME32_03695 [Mojavia pulchra JT2-VF2]|uniref:Periplasmic heavy metal sensor n=1 Tax=Mojavia pulchra JT2-VF2 TaxID=287848 RepID=A0A951UEC7_9NOST|nr:hypothetical protein [Mojavia pulchra JT2-VF2]